MIEMIGVLAVLTILALALVPALLKQMDRSAKDTEAAALKSIITGLQSSIRGTRYIPGTSDFAQTLAVELGWLVSEVSTNARGNPRVYLVDPALRIGTNTGATLPYAQSVLGSTDPFSPRVMVVTSMGLPLPASITSGAATNATVFDQIWNSADGVAPTSWTGGGNWDDLMVQRMNLAPLFVQVILNNNPPTNYPASSVGRYSIDNTNNHIALPTLPFSAHFIVGTLLGLHANGGAMQVQQVLSDIPQLTNTSPCYLSPSFVYEKGIWRGKLFMSTEGQKHGGVDLQAAYEIFMSGPPNVYQVGGVTQASLTWDMYLYMSNYVYWANSSPPFASGASSGVKAAQSAMASDVGVYCNKKASSH